MSDEKIIFSMHRVNKVLNSGKTIIKNISLSFFYGAKIGIIGLNGAGKSTVLRIIAGLDTSFQGEVIIDKAYSVGFLPQEPELDDSKTVRQIVEEGASDIVQVLKDFEEINNRFGDSDVLENPEKMEALIKKQAEIQERIDLLDAWELDSKLKRAMDALNCPPEESKIEKLSGGERRRVALVRLLLMEPDILLLDEPTNHLDAESVFWLEQHLKQYKGTVIAVTHDRYFLDNVSGWILELDRGEGIPWKGNYSSWLDQKSKRLATEEKQESRRQKILQRELEWSRMTPKARQAKSKARLSSYEKMLGEKAKEKIDNLELFIPNGQRLGNKVIEFEKVSKAFDNQVLVEELSFSLPPAGVVGVIGPNGAGKTTLFRMIMGEEKPDSGEIQIGDTVQLGYVDQRHKDVDPEKSVWEVVSGGHETISIGGNEVNSRAYLAQFNFTGADQSKKVKVLSGGERNRLHLAMTLKLEANVLLLDEPTNDIDVNTLRALEEGIENFAGCAVIISHDRWFLDRVCTHMLAFEGDAVVKYFEGGFTDYEENRRKRLGEQIERFKYKKLVKN
ncbi:MAG: energy-dependent translational throttle protein EttA [Vicingaceae bacterium]